MFEKYALLETPIDKLDGFYKLSGAECDEYGNDYPGSVLLNVGLISSIEEKYGFDEWDREKVESMEYEDAYATYYKFLYTKVTMNNGEVFYISNKENDFYS